MKSKALEYGWIIAKNLATIFIVIGVFGLAKTTFETAVLSGLVLIYISVKMSMTILEQNQLSIITMSLVNFKSMKRLITRDLGQFLKDGELEKIDETKNEEYEEELKNNMKPVVGLIYTTKGFQIIIFTMALLNLFSSLKP